MKIRGTVGVIGQGYVGLPLSSCAALAGWKVLGFEKDPIRLQKLKESQSPIEDVDDSAIREISAEHGFEATDEISRLAECEVVVICLPTPLDDKRAPDLTILTGAVESLAAQLKPGALLISESTSFPGTLREVIAPILFRHRGKDDIHLACSPERVDPGNQKWKLKNTPRLVAGLTKVSSTLAVDFYKTFCDSVIEVSKPEVAEMAKLLENSFRLVNISLINEIARLATMVNIDINEVVAAASTKPYGFMPFKPSIGAGGHCIPVDPMYLTDFASRSASKLRLIELADEVNQTQPAWVMKRVKEILNSDLKNLHVHLVGMGYKSATSDTRESASLKLLQLLRESGAKVTWQDCEVSEVDGEYSAATTPVCNLIVYCQVQKGFEFLHITKLGIPVLDCTGTLEVGTWVHYL